MTAEDLTNLLKTSPLVALILYVLWQYRRDYINLFSSAQATSKELVDLLKTVVTALESVKASADANKFATEENTRVIRSLTNTSGHQRVQGAGSNKDPGYSR